MTIIQAIILSIVEGITEFLPVSSTGHLILVSKMLGVPGTDFTKSFEIFIQLGAIMAVVSLYWKMILKKPELIKPVLLAFIPTGLLGIVLYRIVKTYLLSSDVVVISMLFSVGIALVALEWFWKNHPPKANRIALSLSPIQLLTIGVFQAFSIIPGVSRAAVTIVGAMCMGLSRTDAVEFSFLLAVPTMVAATALDLAKNLHILSQANVLMLGIGFFTSWIVAAVVIKAFVKFVKHATFTGFGVYRIVLALLYLLALQGLSLRG